MNWGTRIVITFIVFVGIIATLVTISMKQDVNLVADDYYVKELAYQDQIVSENNINELSVKPKVTLDRSKGLITLHIDGEDLDGEVLFFRPSKASMDKKYKLQTNAEGLQVFKINDFDKGLWKVKVNWTSEDKPYYLEQSVVL